ncbi:MAG: leucine-rich repeat domain-containing protein [Paludibacteraceae bacterium]|nr:leucine-rich repeat domain-containing protein [Paludibacteraceae bacterium]
MIRKITLFLMLFFPVVAGAFTIGDLSYTITDKEKLTVSVGAVTTSISGVVIPETVKYDSVEYIVTSIARGAFDYCRRLTSITIPNSVTTIGDDAFFACRSLTSVEIPNSVTAIGKYAFYDCSGLTSIDIPNSVTAIGKYAFYDCSGLTSIDIPNSVTEIGDDAFYGCSSLTSVDVPESVATIGEDAFYDIDTIFYAGKASGTPWGASKVIRGVRDGYFLYADSTKSCIVGYLGSDSVVVIPNSVTAIGANAFNSYAKLTTIEIPNSVTAIGSGAFYGCSSLTSIDVPNSVTGIGDSAFYKCKGLNLLNIPESVATIGKNAFYGIDTIFYAGKATGEPWDAYKVIRGARDGYFVYADSTKSCVVGYLGSDSVVVIPNSVTVIGDNAFKGYAKLTSIEIPNSVTAIGSSAFYGCSSLTSIDIPNSVTGIGEQAFYKCKGLNLMNIPESVDTIGKNAFYGIDTIFYAGKATGELWRWGQYKVIRGVRNGDFVYADGTKSCIVGYLGSDSVIVIPNTVTAIGANAFKGYANLTSIEIPNSVTAIGSSTFYGCSSLTSIEISNSVTGIGEQAFYNCKGLNLMDVPESVATIGKNAFYGIDTIFYAGKASGSPWGAKKVIRGNVKDGDFVYADSTKSCIVVYLGSDSVVVIPNSVVSIGAEAFNNCKGLKFLSVPDSVSFIGENAFLGVDTISYFGDAEGLPWGAKIIIHDHVYNYCYCACGLRDTVSHCIFDIYTADDLFEFARLVNEGNQWLDARLMNDIVVNEMDWSEYDVKDTLPSTLLSSVNIWKGIKKPYRATFDGQNHSIKGLLYHSNGFFDQLSGAAIKNVGFENCRMVTYRDDDVCGLISRRADSSVFINCHTSGEILNYNVASGFVGYGSNLTFESCYNMASVEGVDVVAGFTSGISYDKNRCIIFDDCWNGGTISSENSSTMTLGGLFSSKGYGFILYINNCYNIGDIYTLAYWTDETGCGGLVGGRGAVDVFASNCYNIGKISATEEVHVAPLICNPYKMYEEQNFVIGEEVSSSGLFYHNCYYLDSCVQTGIKTDLSSDLDIYSMTSEQFANGEVCYRLNKGVTDGTQPFYQDLADIRPASSDMQSITIDPYPVLDKSHRTVYTDSVSYFNRLVTTSEKVVSTTIVEPKIYSDGNTLYVKNATGRVVLYEVNGRVVYSKKAEENAVIEISNLKTGVYLLVVDGSPSKVVVR